MKVQGICIVEKVCRVNMKLEYLAFRGGRLIMVHEDPNGEMSGIVSKGGGRWIGRKVAELASLSVRGNEVMLDEKLKDIWSLSQSCLGDSNIYDVHNSWEKYYP